MKTKIKILLKVSNFYNLLIHEIKNAWSRFVIFMLVNKLFVVCIISSHEFLKKKTTLNKRNY